MGARLFVAHENVAHPALLFGHMKGVIDGEDGPAGVPKNCVHAVTAQSIHQCFSTGDPLLAIREGSTGDRWRRSQGHSVVTQGQPSD